MTRIVAVAPERLAGWLRSFADRHGEGTIALSERDVEVAAPDGTRCVLEVPFPPMEVDVDAPYGGLVDHAGTDRRVGILLVRRGGYAVGIAQGRRLVESKVGSRHVQGRTAAGGWSQRRFARRREQQAKQLYTAAADVAVRILVPAAGDLTALVLGGDRRGAAEVMADLRLAGLRDLVVERQLDVPDPKLEVLRAAPDKLRAVRIRIEEDPADPA